MLHSDFSLFGRSIDSWDTNCARQFLQIPKDELEVLDRLPGWSVTVQKTTEKQLLGKDINIQIVEGPSTSSLEISKTAANPLDSSIQNTSNKDSPAHNFDLPPKKKAKISSSAEKQFSNDISLCGSKIVEVSSSVPNKKQHLISVTDIQAEEFFSPDKSKTSSEHVSLNMSAQQLALSKLPVEKHQLLNSTYVVPIVLDDKTNNIQTIAEVHSQKASGSPAKKRTFEKLRSQSSSCPLEESFSPTGPKFGGHPVFPTNTVQTQVNNESFLSKKLKLLEKRFSPSKDFGLISSSEKCNVNFRSIGSQISSKAILGSGEDSVLKASSFSRDLVYEKGIGSLKTGLNTNETTTKEKEFTSIVQPSQKEYVEAAALKSNSNVFEEESFMSQPIPCGQPPSNTPGTQSPIKCQDIEPAMEENVAEEADVPTSVLSENCSDQVKVQKLVPVKVGKEQGKRKRKSKSGKPSKKLDVKPLVNIQFTAEQVKNMIEIIKHLQQ